MTVITISRQMGSLGRDVAQLVAKRLGYRFVWRDIINEAARRASTPEVALALIDELDLLGLSPSLKARKTYCQAMKQVLDEIAVKGDVVILGRAGQVVLRDYTQARHVRIIAPLNIRASRIAEQQHIPLSAAQAQVEASDIKRREYLMRFYKVRWDDPELYHLVINTALLTPQQAADIIVCLASQTAPSVFSDPQTGGAGT